jgi:tetratricopeptide (TPR) repeat protein
MSPRKRATTSGQSVSDSYIAGDNIHISDVAGDVIISDSRAPYRIDESIAVVALSPEQARAQPSRLLLARHEIVPFVGRTEELSELTDWLASDDATSVRLIFGSGGQGKTRLASQLARQTATAGWAVWWVRHVDATSPQSRTDIPHGRGLLVILDYADRWPLSHLSELLAHLHALQLRSGVTLKVLLLARSAGFWWPAFRDALDRDYGIEASRQELLPLGHDVDREELFRQAMRCFAAAMQISGADGLAHPPGLHTDDSFAQILAVHMAALGAVDAHHRGSTAPTDPQTLSIYLLNREVAHWHEIHTRTDDPRRTDPETMARAVYVATLTGPLPHPDARDVLSRAELIDPGIDIIIGDHRFCYPPQNSGTVLQSLLPDRLGEDLVALTTPGQPHATRNDWQPDAWAIHTPFKLLAGDPAPVWAPTAVTVLVETAHRWPHVAKEVLYPLIRQHPSLALAAGGATLTRLAELPDIDLAALERIEALLPVDRHIDLDVAAAAITDILIADRLETTGDPAQLGRLHAIRSERLARAGRHRDAIAPAEEAVALLRTLAVSNPARYEREFAGTLGNLGTVLAEAGRHQDALVPTEEAASIYRRLATDDPTNYLHDLATALGNLGPMLSELGRKEEALQPAADAVSIHRQLTEANPTANMPDLAMALSNLGLMLSALHRHDDALDPAEEAVTIYRQLADTNPAGYLPGLAMSLTNLGGRQAETGRHTSALASADEAVNIYRQLADSNPAAYRPGLATSLTNLASRLTVDGRQDEALISAEEAVEVYRLLTDTNPAAYTSNLAGTLANLGVHLAGADRHDEALIPTEEAAAIFRRLALTNPTAHLPGLAMCQNNLGLMLSALDRQAEAITPSEEAVTIRRRLSEAQPTTYLPVLATSVTSLASQLSDLGRHNEAIDLNKEATDIYRRLAEAAPNAYLPKLAGTLSNLGGRLLASGRHNEALLPSKEAVDIYAKLAAASPSGHLPERAASLNNLSIVLARLYRHDEGLASAQEAVRIYSQLTPTTPHHLPALASALTNVGGGFARLGQLEEAIVPAQEAAQIYRQLTATNPIYKPDLAASLNNVGIVLSGLGHREAAVAATTEATAIRASLASAAGP